MRDFIDEELINKAYLGYGVYIGIQPATGDYWLYLKRGNESHFIALTQDEIDSLIVYTKNHPIKECP